MNLKGLKVLIVALLLIGAVLVLFYSQQKPDIPVTTTTTIHETTTIPETSTTIPTSTTTVAITTTSLSEECTADLDCSITGNFNQTCAPKDSESKDDTERKPEYKCLEKTICSCIKEKCEWKPSNEYDECMLELSPSYCTSDSDCVPKQCCHPTSYVNKKFKPDCSDIFCTEDCQKGTMDCGCGKPACIDNKCIVLWRRDRSCRDIVALTL
ncbi:MAG: hypothetical protein KKB24_04225 [Candidatus Altiarchaeota archaeon]|nr:hypothetical protein [Candidatus Altiarchaeota archaeon]